MESSIVGHYRVVSTLGEGAMGEVCRGTDTNFGGDVAIKVVPAAFAQDTARIGRFKSEAICGVEESALVLEWVEAEMPGAYRTERR